MAWYDQDSLLSLAFSPHAGTIAITLLVAFVLPVIVHFFLYRAKTPSSLPTFLVLGSSGSGKTALVSQFEHGKPSTTHTSIAPLTVQTVLPPSTVPSSRRYRSANDFETKEAKQLLLTDTPGHAKLRHYAYDSLNALCASQKKGSGTSGVIFVVDAANVSADDDGDAAALRDAAGYLHDVLMVLQRSYTGAKSSKYASVPVLVAANKMDLFTALPAPLVKAALEREITRLRATRAKGIAAVGKAGKGEGLDAAGSDDEGAGDDEADVLGGGDAESKFTFEQMDEWGVDVIVTGGNVTGEEGPGVEGWWEWIAGLL